MSISNYAEQKILDNLFNNVAFGAVVSTYIKLHIGNPGDDCTTSPAAHTTRVIAGWAAASGGTITTDVAVTFTPMAAVETISHISIWDNLTAGNPLWYGPLIVSRSVGVGDTLNFAIGEIDVVLD